MRMSSLKQNVDAELVKDWALPPAATLGSSVRAKGILLEIRARLPLAMKKSLELKGIMLALSMSEGAEVDFRSDSAIVASALRNIESLPVIPREIEDILAISTTERHRWLKDGRLRSAGTRTVKLRGRTKKITFHVFHPREVEELLDGDLIAAWREEDALTAAENRRRGAWKAKLRRSPKRESETSSESDSSPGGTSHPTLLGWAEFERDGPLR